VLSGGSGHATPNKGSSTATPRSEETKAGPPEVVVQMADSWAPGVEEMEEWQPEGGILLDGGDSEVVEDEVDDGGALEGRTWTGVSDAERVVEDVLSPGTLFGEGMEFRGEVVQPAVGRWGTGADGDDVGVPLRRGGSEVGKTTRGDLRTESARKVYEVVRQLGSGSYAVVSLVRERGGRKREFGEPLRLS